MSVCPAGGAKTVKTAPVNIGAYADKGFCEFDSHNQLKFSRRKYKEMIANLRSISNKCKPDLCESTLIFVSNKEEAMYCSSLSCSDLYEIIENKLPEIESDNMKLFIAWCGKWNTDIFEVTKESKLKDFFLGYLRVFLNNCKLCIGGYRCISVVVGSKGYSEFRAVIRVFRTEFLVLPLELPGTVASPISIISDKLSPYT